MFEKKTFDLCPTVVARQNLPYFDPKCFWSILVTEKNRKPPLISGNQAYIKNCLVSFIHHFNMTRDILKLLQEADFFKKSRNFRIIFRLLDCLLDDTSDEDDDQTDKRISEKVALYRIVLTLLTVMVLLVLLSKLTTRYWMSEWEVCIVVIAQTDLQTREDNSWDKSLSRSYYSSSTKWIGLWNIYLD